jgi:hypothetical protein
MHPPPNDNQNHPFHQYLQKLTARTQFQPPLTSRVPIISQPPTRYTPVIAHKESELEYDDDHDEYDDYYDREDTVEYCSTPATAPDSEPNASYGNGLKTVTISLNSSIQITGDGNSVAIASREAQPQTWTPEIERNTTTNVTRDPKPKITNTIAAIIASLQQSGAMTPTNAESKAGHVPYSPAAAAPAAVEINIDAGVKIKGCQNVVCFGAFAPRTGGLKMNSHGQDARKRRAQSV